MVYLVGIVGFLAGFALGQALLFQALKGKSNKDILSSKSIRLKYGLLNWVISIFTCYCAVRAYQFLILNS